MRASVDVQLEGRTGLGGFLATLFSAGTFAVLVFRFGRWARGTPAPLPRLPLMCIYFVLFYVVQAVTGISVQIHMPAGRRFVIRNHTCIFVVAETNFVFFECLFKQITINDICHWQIVGLHERMFEDRK